MESQEVLPQSLQRKFDGDFNRYSISSPAIMEYVCGIFYTQGFYFNDKFYPREAALLGPHIVMGFTVDPGLDPNKMSKIEKNGVDYATNRYHGLPLKPRSNQTPITLERLLELIELFYSLNKNPDKFLIARKSKESEAVLTEAGIPRININRLGARWRALEDISDLHEPVHLHHDGTHFRCSLNAVTGMKKLIKKPKFPSTPPPTSRASSPW